MKASENEVTVYKRSFQTNPPGVGTILKTKPINAHSFRTVMLCISKSLSKTDDRSVCHIQAELVVYDEVF